MSPFVYHHQNGTSKMLKHFSKFSRLAIAIVFISSVFTCSGVTAQSVKVEQEQQIAIWTVSDSDETYLCVPSGIDFCLANAIATVLEQSGHNDIQLYANSQTSLPFKSQYGENNPSKSMLIRISAESAQIYSGFEISTLRRIVDALKPFGVDRFTLVDSSVLVDLDSQKWRVLHESSGGEQGSLRDAETKLFAEVSKVSKQIETMLLKLKPVLEDVRVFSDKVARNPLDLK